MSGVAITLASHAVSGGNVADTITTLEYADSTAAVTAVTSSGFLPVVSGLAADGTSLKKRAIPVAAIKEIVSL